MQTAIEPLEIKPEPVKEEPIIEPVIPVVPVLPVIEAPPPPQQPPKIIKSEPPIQTPIPVVPTIPSLPIAPIPEALIEEPVNNENEPQKSKVEVNNSNNGSSIMVLNSPKKLKSEKIWDIEERRKVETRNNNMRQIIYKEVKRPGRNYDKLLELLKELHGPADIRQQYILDVIKEATRFKRNHMAKIILQNMPNLVSIDSTT